MSIPKSLRKSLTIGATLFYLLNSAGCGYAQETKAYKTEQKGSRLEETVSSEHSELKEADREYIDSFIEFYKKEVEPLDSGTQYDKVSSLLEGHIKKIQQYDLSSLSKKEKEALSNAFGDYGLTFNMNGDSKSASHFYEKALELNPDNFDTLINMGYLQYKKFNNLKKGMQYYQRALEADPDNTNKHIAVYYVNKISKLLRQNQ
jgi:tetratricopeptide (TPR) repeat protein